MNTGSLAYACECGQRLPTWLAQCPRCLKFSGVRKVDDFENNPPALTVAPSVRVDLPEDWKEPKPTKLAIVPAIASVPVPGLEAPEESEPAPARPQPITEISCDDKDRISTGLAPLDRVLGGGVAMGTCVLIGGEPGAGKSSILMQSAAGFALDNRSVLYATGEESERQVAIRAHRLGAAHENIALVRETNVDAILAHAYEMEPDLLIVDSISVVTTEDSTSAAGSVPQVRACAQLLANYAHETDCTVFLIGHVTRDGSIAGPRTLDHIVDTVLLIDQPDPDSRLRTLRAFKNRYGDTTERGALEMTADGLIPSHHDVNDQAESLVPVMQEIIRRYREAGGVIDEGLRDRIAGRLDLDG